MEVRNLRFWEVRTETNRDVLFADPELLWNTAKEYFNYCVENPLKPGKAEGGEQFAPKVQALSLKGMCIYLGCTAEWLQDFKQELEYKFNKITDAEQAILEVIYRVEEVISLYKFNYAAAGLLNARMITRELDLDEQRKKEYKEKRMFAKFRASNNNNA